MSPKSIESEYYLASRAIAVGKPKLTAKIRVKAIETTEQFEFISLGQWLLLLLTCGICGLFITSACIWIA